MRFFVYSHTQTQTRETIKKNKLNNNMEHWTELRCLILFKFLVLHFIFQSQARHMEKRCEWFPIAMKSNRKLSIKKKIICPRKYKNKSMKNMLFVFYLRHNIAHIGSFALGQTQFCCSVPFHSQWEKNDLCIWLAQFKIHWKYNYFIYS